MKYLLTAIGVVAAIALIVASCFMNFTFWHEQGRTEFEANIFGGVSVAVDILKSVLPVLIGFAVAARRWLYVVTASFGFVLFLSAALLAAVGFSSMNRGHVVGGRETVTAKYDLAKHELTELDNRASGLTGYPPAGTIEDNLKAMQQDKRWTSSASCTDATAGPSREFCTSYFAERAKLSSAIEANRIEERRTELRREVNQLRVAGAGEAADPQASLLARLLPSGVGVSRVQLALNIFFAVLVEFGAALGLYMATRHGAFPARVAAPRRARSAAATEPASSAVTILAPRKPARQALLGNKALGRMVQQLTHDDRNEPERFTLDEEGRAFMAGKG